MQHRQSKALDFFDDLAESVDEFLLAYLLGERIPLDTMSLNECPAGIGVSRF